MSEDYKSYFKGFTDNNFVHGFETTEEKCIRLQAENAHIKDELSAERQMRYMAEQKVNGLEQENRRLSNEIEQLKLNPPKRKRKTHK